MEEITGQQVIDELFRLYPESAGEHSLANLTQEVAQTLRVQDLLFSYSSKIASEKNLEKLVMLVADLARQIVEADRCTLWLLDETETELYTYVAHGVPKLRMPADKGLAGEAVKTGETILIGDAYRDARFNQEMDRKTGYRTKAILVIPIRNNEGHIMGAFQAINKTTVTQGFHKRDADRLHMMSTYSGKALEAAMYLERVENTQRTAIYMLGQMAESRSRETGNHVRRVAEYCALIGKYLGLPEDEIDLIRLASPMHDAGKVSTPDAILKKPGRLTEDEFLVMQQHAQAGYDVLSTSAEKIFQVAASIAITHHEKWNGTGYPQGLKETEIPLYGRIVAVADVFDALANDRCYKKAWPLEKVLQLFQEEKSKHFDPVLVDILLNYIDEFVQINVIYRDHYETPEAP